MNDKERNSGRTSEGTEPNHSSVTHDGKPDDLHDLIGNEKVDEDDPLAEYRKDPNYAALIKELEYIASQARLLFEPTQEAPSDEVWKNIQSKLADEPRDS